MRHAAGYEKLVLYGTSYGTKVALEYAERYPQHVEALVLDSVVREQRAGTVQRSRASGDRLGARRTVLRTARARASPPTRVGDLARLIARLRKRRLRRLGLRRRGHRHAASLGERDVLDILQAGDLNPALRALLPGGGALGAAAATPTRCCA